MKQKSEDHSCPWKLYLFLAAFALALPVVLIFLAALGAALKAEREEYGDPNDPYGGAVDWGKD